MTSDTHILSSLLAQAQISRRIEQYVQAVLGSSQPAYRVSYDDFGDALYRPTTLALKLAQLKLMHDFISGLEHDAKSQELRAFQHACRCVGLEFSLQVGMTCLDESGSRYLSPEESLNWLVASIRVHF